MNFDQTLGDINDFFVQTATPTTFPWLNWNNRPYVSHLELATVPMLPSSLLLCKFDTFEPLATRNVYAPPLPKDLNGATWYSSNFAHLPNFFGDQPTLTYEPLRLQRLLDYVEVPSRFVGTENFLSPGPLNNAAGELIGLNAPTNAPSKMRYPGKLNLNTIDEIAYNGLMGSYASLVPFATFEASRVQAPFRSAECANFVPVGSTVPNSADVTLFRRLDPANLNSEPLFDVNVSPGVHADPNRSASFRYDMRQRLGNLTTTRSNVFAVWITVGFFEVDPITLQPTVREIGVADGTKERYRGFYLIDRSIPVAFEPGQNHNVDSCILSSSIIQRETRSPK